MDVFNVTGVVEQTADFQTFTVAVDTLILPDLSIGIIIQLMILAVFFLSMKFRNIETAPAFATACFITGLVTIPLKAVGILPEYWWWLGLLLIPIAIFVLFWSQKDL